MWIVQNSMEVRHSLEKKGRNLATYDFSTLYTSIPHEALKDKLAQVVMKAFKGNKKKFIRVTSKSARWNNENKKMSNNIDCDTLIKMIDWLIDNTFVTIGSSVFKQVIGIPMAQTVLLTWQIYFLFLRI